MTSKANLAPVDWVLFCTQALCKSTVLRVCFRFSLQPLANVKQLSVSGSRVTTPVMRYRWCDVLSQLSVWTHLEPAKSKRLDTLVAALKHISEAGRCTLSHIKGHGRRKLLLFACCPHSSQVHLSGHWGIPSLVLPSTSLWFQHLLKTSRDDQPCGISHYWILGPSVRRQPLLE